jgi:hypothetical protein
MRKLEFKDIARYLPWGLDVRVNSLITKAWGVDGLTHSTARYIKTDYGDFELSLCKPVLRPLSDLIKTIKHNGEEFVPIVRLAEVSNEPIGIKGLRDAALVTKEGRVIYVVIGEDASFQFEPKLSVFAFFENGEVLPAVCQARLFDLLDEWKFDYRGLIDSGLAVADNR